MPTFLRGKSVEIVTKDGGVSEMEFRRGHRDERRRRVLIEEPVVDTSEGEATPARRRADAPAPEAVPRYSGAALSPRQPRVIDLIPSRWWTNIVLLGLLLSIAAGLETLYAYVALGYTELTVSEVPAIDLSVHGSVATWFSSLLLGTCALYGLLIYQIRRYRVDDYRGRYRMWCWVVPLFVLASVDQVAGLQQSVRTALLHVAGISDYPDALLVWVSSIAVLGGAVGLRLIIEMRGSRLASLLMVVSLACLGAVAASRLEWWAMQPGIFRTMVFSALNLGAHIAVLSAFLLYARHIYQDAQGRVPARRKRRRSQPRKERRRKSAEEGEHESEKPRSRVRRKAGKVTRTDPPHTADGRSGGSAGGKEEPSPQSSSGNSRTTRKEKRRVTADATTTKSSDNSLCEPDEDQVEQPRKLSKSERKRLRKQRRRQQR